MSARNERQLRVLVVEDDEIIRGLLEMALIGEGYSVTAPEKPSDIEDYLSKEDSEDPDIILHDLLVWRFDGVNLMRRFRDKHPSARLIGITAAAGDPDMPCHAVVKKPFVIDELFDSIKLQLRRRDHPRLP